MKIEVFGLTDVLTDISQCQSGANLISIRDRYCDDCTASKYATLDSLIEKNGVNAKVVQFDDIDPYRFNHGMEHYTIKRKFADKSRKPVFFNSDIAQEIVSWVIPLWESDHNVTLKVHCWAGRSRSQAVAYWLNIYFNLVLEKNLPQYLMNNAANIHEKVHFNCEVLRVFSTVFG